MEQFPITVLIVLLTIIIVIVLLQIIKIINSNKGVGYYSFKECFDSENTKNGIENGIIKTSFFYFDKIEKDIKKKILKIDDENKYTFYLLDFTNNETEFKKESIPIIINHEDDSSLELFKILCKLNQIPTKNMIFQLNSLEEANLNCSKMYAIITEKKLNDIFASGYKYSLYNYKKTENSELTAILPYAYLNFLKTKSDLNMTYKFIQFDTCFYTNKSGIYYDNNEKQTDKNIENMYNMFGYTILYKPEVNNLSKNEITPKKDPRQVSPRIKLVSSSNVVGKISTIINNEYIQFKTTEKIDNIFKLKLELGDVIILEKQINKIENNTYYYITENTIVTSFMITDYVEKKNNTIDFVTDKVSDYNHIQKNDNLYFAYIQQSATVYDITFQNDYISIKCLTKEKFQNFEYECVTNPNIKFQHQCESEYTIDGVKKKHFDVWDKRCESHTECPFFSLNNDNYNGKCNDNGFCEMPIGVKNIGYRKYSTDTDSADCPLVKKDTGECIFVK